MFINKSQIPNKNYGTLVIINASKLINLDNVLETVIKEKRSLLSELIIVDEEKSVENEGRIEKYAVQLFIRYIKCGKPSEVYSRLCSSSKYGNVIKISSQKDLFKLELDSKIDTASNNFCNIKCKESSFLCYNLQEGCLKAFNEKDVKGLILTAIKKHAENALTRGPYSVVHKTSLPPSNDIHDYWHPAPYWWPNPNTSTGLPYVQRDGERIPGAEMYGPDNEKYDRTRIQMLFEDTTSLALAWWFTESEKYIKYACRLVRTWFINPETRMNPHLKFSQVRLGHNNDRGHSKGIIELKDFYYFLDAVKIIEQAGQFNEEEQEQLRAWFAEYLDWLLNSSQGIAECKSHNNHGISYDLQVIAIANFIQEPQVVMESLERAQARISDHFAKDGSQPHELKRTITAHYCTFNLQQWVNFAQIAEKSAGVDFWTTGPYYMGKPPLRRAIEWIARYIEGNQWPYRQIRTFDPARWLPIVYTFFDKYQGEVVSPLLVPLSRSKAIYHPHDGIPPYWQLTLNAW